MSRLRGFRSLADFLPDVLDQRVRRRARQEDLADSHRLERRDVLVRDDPARDDEDVLAAAFLQQPQDLGEQDVVRAGQDRDADDVDVLLDRRGGDLLGRLAQPE
jgi:hypothetical protein